VHLYINSDSGPQLVYLKTSATCSGFSLEISSRLREKPKHVAEVPKYERCARLLLFYCLYLVSDLRTALISRNMLSIIMSRITYSGREVVNKSRVKRKIDLYSFLCSTSILAKTDTRKWRQISVATLGPLTTMQQRINYLRSVEWFYGLLQYVLLQFMVTPYELVFLFLFI
jgi:hypothetical protein